jgi:hypothetical protein
MKYDTFSYYQLNKPSFSAASSSQEYILESYIMEFNKNPTTLVQATLRQFPSKGFYNILNP